MRDQLYQERIVALAKAKTGAGKLDTVEAASKASALRAQAKVPLLVGFGIRDAASAAALAPCADGVVVGSALVEAMATSPDPCIAAAEFLRPLRAALDTAAEG